MAPVYLVSTVLEAFSAGVTRILMAGIVKNVSSTQLLPDVISWWEK